MLDRVQRGACGGCENSSLIMGSSGKEDILSSLGFPLYRGFLFLEWCSNILKRPMSYRDYRDILKLMAFSRGCFFHCIFFFFFSCEKLLDQRSFYFLV